jgi:rhamnogalacturonyl hydrolase YesR
VSVAATALIGWVCAALCAADSPEFWRGVLPVEIPGYAVSAAGTTSGLAPIPSLEPTAPCGPGQSRLVILAGLDAKSDAGTAVRDFLRWWFGPEAVSARERWQIAVVPEALGAGGVALKAGFPPQKGFFNDPGSPEARYLWRWSAMSAPDMVVDLRAGDSLVYAVNGAAREWFPRAEEAAPDELVGALGRGAPSGIAPVPGVRIEGSPAALGQALREMVARPGVRSALRETMESRRGREPLQIARVLAARYPAAPGMSYIPALAWSGAMRVSRITGEATYRERALAQMQPFLSGEKPALGKQPGLPAVAGHLALSDLAAAESHPGAAALARAAADFLVLPTDSPEVVPHGTRWTDDMFMATAVLSRVAGSTFDPKYSAAVQRLLTTYAARLQQPDGIFIHVEGSPFAWGRGNGFAAFGLMDALTHLPAAWEGRRALLEIYRKHMRGLLVHQSPDGAWRQVIDHPGAYREFTATAMITTAMARGVRLGWIEGREFNAAVERGWRALSERIAADGTLVDVCTGTGAKKDCDVSHYLYRDAIFGADDRGGAMALTAALEMLDFYKR